MPTYSPPLVNGISPNAGPPGTLLTIRGTNLGLSARDLLSVKICGVECVLSAEWYTGQRITARSGQFDIDLNDRNVIVTTRSGGVGTCMVEFRAVKVIIGPTQKSAVWVEETQLTSPLTSGVIIGGSSYSSLADNPLNLSDENVSKASVSEDDLLTRFPGGSPDLSMDNFDPTMFLLHNHSNASFEDLKSGLAHLKMNQGNRSEGPLAFIKTNLSTFMDAQRALDQLDHQLKETHSETDGRVDVSKLEEILEQTDSCARSLFQEVLIRKDRADATRNALAVLNRYRFLFNLPSAIDANIVKGNYDMVINDYQRARSHLSHNTDAEIFKEVYNEVEIRIEKLRTFLREQLMELPSSFERQKKYVRYLLDLGAGGDPAWECLVNQQKWLCQLFIDQISVAQKRSTKVEQPARSNLIGQASSDRVAPPPPIVFIEKITELASEHLPHFWHLGRTYFTGSLLLSETGERANRVVDAKKHTQFKELVSEAIVLLVNLVRSAFLPDSLENVSDRERYGTWDDITAIGSWMSHAVRDVRWTVSSLSKLDLPGECQDHLQELAYDMRNHCMRSLFKQAIEDTKALKQRETWLLEMDDTYGATTQLPTLFESIVVDVLEHLHEVVMRIRDDKVDVDMFTNRMVQKEATSLCCQLLQAFTITLDSLNSQGADQKFSVTTGCREEKLTPALRCLIIWSNCDHTRRCVLPRLLSKLQSKNYPQVESVEQQIVVAYQVLDDKLFNDYIGHKSILYGEIESKMYMGGFDWCGPACLRPNDVRSYTMETILGLVSLQAEVTRVSPLFVDRVLRSLVDSIIDEIARLIECVPEFSVEGAMIALTNCRALRMVLLPFMSEETKQSFDSALTHVPRLNSENSEYVNSILLSFRTRLSMPLACFKPRVSKHYLAPIKTSNVNNAFAVEL